MKIAGIKWKNHPILGDMKLDFINTRTGQPYDVIIFAGENGTGKTTILTSMSDFLNKYPMEHIEYIEYIINNDTYKAIPPTDQYQLREGAYTAIQLSNGRSLPMHTGKNRGGGSTTNPEIDNNPLNIRFYGCVYSKARADYKTKRITSTTAKQLDESNQDIDNEEDYTSLKQLLVDICEQDYKEYAEGNKQLGANPKPWADFYPTSKMYRFSNAFDNFFENMKYSRVADRSNEKVILFKKSDKEVPIDSLSTGEKQIVFRGAFLLRNIKNISGGTIFIDEPELSMHPKWEQKILQYYRDLFTDSATRLLQTQIFIATHSEHVMKEALKHPNDNLVIVLKGNGDSKPINAPTILPTITSAETNYIAFDIVSNDYHIELYGYLQQKYGLSTIKSCDNHIISQPQYDASKHEKRSSYGNTTYSSLSTYIRNAIDHPDSGNTFTDEELRTSIELLQELVR